MPPRGPPPAPESVPPGRVGNETRYPPLVCWCGGRTICRRNTAGKLFFGCPRERQVWCTWMQGFLGFVEEPDTWEVGRFFAAPEDLRMLYWGLHQMGGNMPLGGPGSGHPVYQPYGSPEEPTQPGSLFPDLPMGPGWMGGGVEGGQGWTVSGDSPLLAGVPPPAVATQVASGAQAPPAGVPAAWPVWPPPPPGGPPPAGYTVHGVKASPPPPKAGSAPQKAKAPAAGLFGKRSDMPLDGLPGGRPTLVGKYRPKPGASSTGGLGLEGKERPGHAAPAKGEDDKCRLCERRLAPGGGRGTPPYLVPRLTRCEQCREFTCDLHGILASRPGGGQIEWICHGCLPPSPPPAPEGGAGNEEEAASGSGEPGAEELDVPRVTVTPAMTMEQDGPLVKPGHKLPREETAGRSWGSAVEPIRCSGTALEVCREKGVVNCVSGSGGGKCHNRICLLHLEKCVSCLAGPLCCRHTAHDTHKKWAEGLAQVDKDVMLAKELGRAGDVRWAGMRRDREREALATAQRMEEELEPSPSVGSEVQAGILEPAPVSPGQTSSLPGGGQFVQGMPPRDPEM